ncbi:MAG: D-glycero-beta-D-manno-heptose 1-phosphate adenylyltransferase [Proteobacteria bacterium]|nr:D-glycero-beta-D-manno-heptose 1-phosphate adenylyltransferase [Pseudomonadota bacterium]
MSLVDSEQDPFSQVGFLQFEIVQADIRTNLEQVKVGLSRLEPAPGSLIGLPEMWATGFVYEQLDVLSKEVPELLEELEELAVSHGVVLAGSLPDKKGEGESAALYNTLFFSGIGAAGSRGISKQHLFSFWKEDAWFQSGRRPAPVGINDRGLAGGLICYDLRFPETAQLQCRQGADLLLMSAQWPLARIEQWKILLQARAIENQVFIVAANACGRWEGLQMGGHSLVIAPDGEILAEAGEETASAMVSLNWEVLRELRGRFNTVAPTPWSGEDSDKIFALDALVKVVARRKKVGQKIVFTNGCFDILHAGHVDYLQKARRQGDFLILGLNDDQSIRSIKGADRPINEESKRARVLAALGCVDAVVLFGEDTPINLITRLTPHVLVKGADWEEHEIVGAAEVKASGGRVERIVFTNQTSTTGIIKQIKSGN